MSAAAVLVALVAAMFVSLGSVRAVDYPACTVNTTAAPATNYLLATDTCNITNTAANVVKTSDANIASIPDAADDGTAGAADVEVTAVAPGTATVTVLASTAADAGVIATYKVEVLSKPTISITFNDTDDTVKAGTPVVATITTRGFGFAHRVDVSVPSTGLFFTAVESEATDPDADATLIALVAPSQQVVYSVAPPATTGFDGAAGGAVDGLFATATLSTAGAPPGQYVVTASAATGDIDPDTEGNQIRKASTTATLTVGDPGKALASATLTLGMRTATATETGTDKAGGDGINLVIEAFNSLGAKSNNGDVNTIIVSAIGSSEIEISGHDSSTEGALTIGEDDETAGDEVGQKHTVTVSKDTPGTVEVTATVVGPSGAPMTETITLTFTGDPETHSVADPGDALERENDVYKDAMAAVPDDESTTGVDESKPASAEMEGGLKFEVTGADKAGNQSALTVAQITPRVLDADGKNVSSKFNIREEIKAPGTTSGVVVIRVGTGASKLDAGTYTLETRLTGKDTQKTEFSVSGDAANVELEVTVTPDPLELGSLVDVTATVTDANGTPVADGTPVDFASGGSLTLDDVGTVEDVKTEDGVAKARFIVSKGEGLATIIADADDGTATGTATVMLAAPEAADDDEPETLGLHCLSSNQGFATYSCGIDASASEIFGLVSGRGATAVHLWNGSAWVRYSVVDGTEVPGSSDFMVAENDILYISN